MPMQELHIQRLDLEYVDLLHLIHLIDNISCSFTY